MYGWFAGELCSFYIAFISLFSSLAVSLCFCSLSVLHRCKAFECGSLKDDSSVAHLIVAWPYLGCPEILLSACVVEQAMRRQHDEHFLLSSVLFFRSSDSITDVSSSSQGQIFVFYMGTSRFSLFREHLHIF